MRGSVRELSGDGEVRSAVDESAVANLQAEHMSEFICNAPAVKKCGAILRQGSAIGSGGDGRKEEHTGAGFDERMERASSGTPKVNK